LRQAGAQASCPYLIVDVEAQPTLSSVVNLPDWAFQATVRRPTDKTENVLLYKRVSLTSRQNHPPPPAAPTARRALSELKIISQHAGTVLVGQLAVMAFGVADTVIAGRYSDEALAALSVGSALYVSVYVGPDRHRAGAAADLVRDAGRAPA
jgi:hypothetical protein